MSIKTKICGLTQKEAVKSAVGNGADFVGFVFFPRSVRHISPEQAASLSQDVSKTVKSVAVVVDASDQDLDHIFAHFKPDYLQCHGEESEERIYQLHMKYALPIIKAVPVRSSDDIAKGHSYANVADMLLFDAKIPAAAVPGGNGIAFDWTLLRARKFLVPWFLSGGINIENVTEAIEITGASQIDISSSLESEPGVKDPELICKFLEKVKQYDQEIQQAG